MSALPDTTSDRHAALAYLAALAFGRAGAAAPPWVLKLRREAHEAFLSLGLPTPRQDGWRAINLTPVFAEPWTLPEPLSDQAARAAVTSVLHRLDPIGIAGIGGPRACFVNGRGMGGTSAPGLPHGVFLGTLADALASRPERLEGKLASFGAHASHPIAALNTALLNDGFVLDVPAGVELVDPIHVVHVTAADGAPVLDAPRTLISLGAGSRATVVETYVSLDGAVAFVIPQIEAIVGEGAVLDHTLLQAQGMAAAHVGHLSMRVAKGGQAATRLFSLGARLSRNETRLVLDGAGATGTLDGLFCARGTQVTDAHTLIEHVSPHGSSQEIYKGIVDDQARGAFDGRIVVHPGAEKTDARQTNRNLILSKSSLIDSRPELEIYNNDVKCSHGSTTGRLDEDAFFYLRSRGLDARAARSLLTWAFASELVSRVKVPVVRTTLERWLLAWLPPAEEVRA